MKKVSKLIFIVLLVGLLFNVNANALDLGNIDKNIDINPAYTKYMQTPPNERGDLIPMPVISMYSDYSVRTDEALPTRYDLRNVNGKNFTTPNGDQGTLGICWSFGTYSALESYLLKTSNTTYSSNAKIFSERQIDYATSRDSLIDYTSKFILFNNRSIGGGGNIQTASEALANGVAAVNISSFKSDLTKNKLEMADVLNYKNSQYELNNTIVMARLDGNNLDLTNSANVQLRQNYLNDVKNYIMTYGAAYVGTTSSQSGCGYYDTNLGNYVIDQDGSCTPSGHAMSIIGWDDNIEYSYCASTPSKHASLTSSCPSGYVVKGKGVWILKNSWGSSQPNPYLAYDSLQTDIAFITNINTNSSKKWDNNYVLRNGSTNSKDSIYYGFSLLKFKLDSEYMPNEEKLEKVKFMTYGPNTSFNVYVEYANNTKSAIKTVSAKEAGLHTADFSGDNVLVNKSSKIVIQSTNGTFAYDFAYAFTSNVNKSVSARANTLNVNDNSITYRLYSETKNIPSGSVVSYKLLNSAGVDFTSHMTVTNNKVGTNNVNLSLKFDGNIPLGAYTLYTVYNGSSFATSTININKTNLANYTIVFNANGGTGTMSNVSATSGYPINLPNNKFVRDGYSFKGWNTKADGTGTSYNNGSSITLNQSANSTVTLYAQWNKNVINPTSTKLNTNKVVLGLNQTYTFSATVTPTNADNKTVTWSSSNTSVARIDSTGKVTAVGYGTTTITATTSNGLKATATVIVSVGDVNTLKIDDIPTQSYTGKAITPNVKITNGNTVLVKNKDYKLSYSKNKNLGTAVVTITGIGDYFGVTTKTFKIVIGVPKTIVSKAQDKSSITVAWSKPSGTITGYEVYGSASPTSGFKKIATITKNSTLTYKKTKLKSNKVYYFKVRSYKTVNKKKYYSSFTAVMSATTATTSPSIKVSSNTNTVNVAWKKVSGATGYEIYQSTDKKKYTKVGTTSNLLLTINNASSAKTYYYKVRAYKTYNNVNVRSSYSKVVKTTTKPETPNVSLIGGATSVKIEWNKVPRSSGYELYQATVKDGAYKKIATITKGSTVSYKKTKLVNSKAYYYRVRAYKTVSGKKIYSYFSKISFVVTKPVAPKLKVATNNSAVKVAWSKVSGVSAYEVYVSAMKDTGYVLLTTTNELSYMHSNLKSASTYYYRVRAIKNAEGVKFNGSISQITALTKA